MTDTTSSQSATAEPELTSPVTPEATDPASTAPEQPLAPETADTLFARHYSIPLTPEASPDGGWLAYLLEGADGSISLWLSPTDGGEPQRVELPFEPVVERDPDSGRLIRGPQWSPDGSTIALAGMVEGEDRTAIWLVPSPVASAAEPVVVAAVAEAAPEAEGAEGEAESESTPVAEADPVVSDEPADTAVEPIAEEPAPVVDGAEEPAPVAAVPAEAPAAPRSIRMLTWGPGSERSPRWTLRVRRTSQCPNRRRWRKPTR